MSMSCCVCEPMETAQSLGNDTHAMMKRPRWVSEHGRHKKCGSPCPVGGLRAWPVDKCSNKDVGESERGARHLVKTDRHTDSE